MWLHQLEPSMNRRNKSCGWICNPTIHLNQSDFTTWISMKGRNKSCGWICNPTIHLNQCDFTTWTSTNEQNEWKIWMNVTPPYIHELKATGWIEFDCIRTMIKNGEDLWQNLFQQPKLQIGCSLICSKPTDKDKIQRIGDITLEIKQT